MSTSNVQLNSSVAVYLSKFDDTTTVGKVQPSIRNEAIECCTDELTKRQRYCVWQLLDYALKRHFGMGVGDYDFTVDSNGKWHCDGACFSLTHCNDVVAVAVSSKPVGVDVEAVANFERKVSDSKFLARVLTADEQGRIEAIDACERARALAELWTRKESLFKLTGGASFVAKNISTSSLAYCQLVQMDGVEYALAVATNDSLAVQVEIVNIW